MGLSTQDPNLGGGSGTPPVADTTLKRLSLTPDALGGSSALSALSVTQTWNTTGAPTALLVDITDTASNSGSLLANFKVGGSSVWQLMKGGVINKTNGGDQHFLASNGTVIWRTAFGGAALYTPLQLVGESLRAGGGVNNCTLLPGASKTVADISSFTLQLGPDHATTATTQTIKAHDVTAGKGAGLDLVGGSSGNGANSGDVRMMAGTAEGVKVYHDETAGAAGIGFFGVGGTLRPTTAFSGVTFLPGMGTQVTEDATFGGYTLAQVVSALQALGLLS